MYNWKIKFKECWKEIYLGLIRRLITLITKPSKIIGRMDAYEIKKRNNIVEIIKGIGKI